MKKRVADIVVETLLENGIDYCFAVVGGGAMHIDNALAVHSDMKKFFCHHEQACSMAAEGFAKAYGKMAMVSVTSGPGAINALNGVQGAFVDSTPMIVIAGHPRWETTVNSTGLQLRFRGVQEYDIVPTLFNMTKYAKTVIDPLSIKREVQKAIDIAISGRRGPTWLSIPLNVQGTVVDDKDLYPCEQVVDSYTYNQKDIDEINKLIEQSERPVILAGSGIRTGCEVERFREWVENRNIPIVSGALLPDIMYEGEKNYYGTSGNVGERRGNFILQNADLIVAIANSLSAKQTGFNLGLFAPHAKIVMVDAGEDEGKKPGLNVDKYLNMDVKFFFDCIADKLSQWKVNKEWIDYCDLLNEKLGDIDEPRHESGNSRVPNQLFWGSFWKVLPENGIIALGNSSGLVGCLQKSIKKPEQRVIVNYNAGSMGDDLPEAIGIAVKDKKEVICVTGDGSIMMNLQELQTIKQYDLNIKIIILSNDGYGAIRQTNKNYFDGMYIGCDSKSGISMPDFEKVADAFGFPFRRCHKVSEIDGSIKWLFEKSGSVLLEVCQKLDDPILPKVLSRLNDKGEFFTPGLHEMFPVISDELMGELLLKKGEH